MDHATAARRDEGTDKRALRTRMRAVWQSADVVSLGPAAVDRLMALPALGDARTVAAYDALPGELPTTRLVELLRSRGVRVLLPVLLDDGDLAWRDVDAAPDARARLGEADVVVVPGRAFDRSGARLGRGGGSYDRTLGSVRDGALVVGLAIDEAVLGTVPTEPHDRRVHAVVTPTTTLWAARLDC